MAYILKRIGTTPNMPYRHFECDEFSDLATIDLRLAPIGSTCYVINTGNTYKLNDKNKWILVPSRSTSGSPGSGSGKPGVVMDVNEPAAYEDGTHPVWVNPQGDYILTAEDFGADPIGSADFALLNAKAYTDEETIKICGILPTGSNTLIWNGDTEGRYSFKSGPTFVHVSDSIPEVSDLKGAKVLVNYGESEYEGTISPGNIIDDVIHISGGLQIIVALKDNAKFYNQVIEKAGVYFSAQFAYNDTVTGVTLTTPNYTGFPSIKKIDEKFLPMQSIVDAVLASVPAAEGGSF